MDLHASYTHRLNLQFFFVHCCPASQSLCLFNLFFFKHKTAFSFSVYSRQCLQHCPAPSMTAGKPWVRHFFPLTCNLKVVSQDVDQNKILLFILMLYIKALTASNYVNFFLVLLNTSNSSLLHIKLIFFLGNASDLSDVLT